MLRSFTAIALALVCAPLLAQTRPAFDASDVRLVTSGSMFGGDGGALRGDRYIIRQATLLDLIAKAYSLDASNVQGGPPWIEYDRFDIVAKAPAGTPSATVKLMLQSLLADRFGVTAHTGSKDLPAYILTQGKTKPKLKEAAGGDPRCDGKDTPAGESGVRQIVLACRNKTMDDLAQDLHNMAGGYFDKPVINSTALEGSWDYDLTWTGRGQLAKAGAEGISIFDAVDKELGLKLALQTAPRTVLLVDKATPPTPNSPDLARLMPPPPPATFDVAVIKPTKPGDNNMRGKIEKNRVEVNDMNLKFIVAVAWKFNPQDDDRIVGPKWLEANNFDIQAKLAPDAAIASGNDVSPVDTEELLHMFQALLIERFQMHYHMEDRPLSVYTLTAGTPKLRPAADPTSRTRCVEGPGADGKDPRVTNPVLNRLMTCTNMTVPQMARKFQEIANGYIHDDVVDLTGISGSYDFTLSFSSAGQNSSGSAAAPAGGASDPTGALTLFEAVNRQLGLKLEKQKRPVPVLVIDHINEKPTEN